MFSKLFPRTRQTETPPVEFDENARAWIDQLRHSHSTDPYAQLQLDRFQSDLHQQMRKAA